MKRVIIRVNGKQVERARWIMEQHLGRKLLSSEHVHHKDENKANDDIDNLEVLSPQEHTKLHATGRGVGRIVSKETRQNMAKAKYGKPLPVETRVKISQGVSKAMKGKPWSEARRAADNEIRRKQQCSLTLKLEQSTALNAALGQ